jgi:pyruvate dehydrogenase E2 component (dihydrolipoamide acetyltransferase)
MASDVLMPRLSDSMEEGTVLKWLVEVGGEVKRGQPLVEIETDKANMTHDADSDGVLLEVLANEGDTLAIGEPIARVGEEGEEQPPPEEQKEEKEEDDSRESTDDSRREEDDEEEEDEPEKPAPAPSKADDGERVKASPVARRMAGEMGVDLSAVTGTGPGGRVVKADVEKAAEEGGAEAPADEPAQEEPPAEEPKEAAGAPAKSEAGAKGEPEVVELTRLQRTVSRRMAESKATAPDFTIELDADMTMCIELRERLKESTEHPPSFNDMVVKAAALALRDHPKVNGAYRDGTFELYPRVNVGVAVAAQDALVVPVVRDADEKSLGEIARRARALIDKVREGTITPPELSGATFTVSNLGMYGIERFTAIINPPQAAILSVGALMKKAVVDDRGRVVARDMMALRLSCDHRILYGADGAEFLAAVRKLLEEPLSLAL